MEMPTSLKTAGKESLRVLWDGGGVCADHCLEQGKWVRRFLSYICFPAFYYMLSTVTFHITQQTVWVRGTASFLWSCFTLEGYKGFSDFPVPAYMRRSLLVADPGQMRRYNVDLLFGVQTCSCSLTYKGFVWCRWDYASSQCVLIVTETLYSYILFPQKKAGAGPGRPGCKYSCILISLKSKQWDSYHRTLFKARTWKVVPHHTQRERCS